MFAVVVQCFSASASCLVTRFLFLAEEAAQNDLNAMKSQVKAVTDEYDRLLEEHSKLQKQVEGNGDKKDD